MNDGAKKTMTFQKQTVELDGQNFEDCQFEDCRLVYRGGEVPRLLENRYVRCTWDIEDAALRMIGFFATLYINGLGDVVEGFVGLARGAAQLPYAPPDTIH